MGRDHLHVTVYITMHVMDVIGKGRVHHAQDFPLMERDCRFSAGADRQENLGA